MLNLFLADLAPAPRSHPFYGLQILKPAGWTTNRAQQLRDEVHPLRVMAEAVVSFKLCSVEDSRGTAMRQRTFQASAVAFVLGLAFSLVWSLLQL